VDQGVPGESIALVHNPASPTDPDPPALAEGATVIRMDSNRGYAGGMNAGIRHHLARNSGLILLATQDLRLRPGATPALVAAAERAPAYGALGPLLWVSGEDRIFSGGGRRGRHAGWVTHVKERPQPAADGIAPSDWVEGACFLVRREVVERVGLLDESLFMYFEETEFCLRTTRAGWNVGVVLDAEAEQESGQSARPGLHAYLISRNGFEYARRSSGFVGVAATARRALLESGRLLRAYPSADTSGRFATRIKLTGMWLGFAHFVRRRFGPPPDRVAGWGRADGA